MSLSSDIAELFASYSEPDAYDTQYQLELFSWVKYPHGYLGYIKMGCRCALCRAGNRDHLRAWNNQRAGKTQTRAYRCSCCGAEGHSVRTCGAEMQRAA